MKPSTYALLFLLFSLSILSATRWTLPVDQENLGWPRVSRHQRRSNPSDLISDEAERRRTLFRFTKAAPENRICWDRRGVDGFHSVVDIHNHFQPFEGPNVPYDTYLDWMLDHGILFSNIVGLGQRIEKTNAEDPNCCYYLHCPTTNYTVRPSTKSDELNAEWFSNSYLPNQQTQDQIIMQMSATFPNLQQPENNTRLLNELEEKYPGVFSWVGEINLVKHALAANGFFETPTVREEDFNDHTPLSTFFKRIESYGWPTTIHADMGCDNFNSVPGWAGKCVVEDEERVTEESGWWRKFLGVHFYAFFDDETNKPKPNFSKIKYVKLFDALLSAFPKLKVTWAHMGLSKELLNLHPIVHSHILQELFNRHPNLYADISWDIIAQKYLINHDPDNHLIIHLNKHEDLTPQSEHTINLTAVAELREQLQEIWDLGDDKVDDHGSADVLDGPTFSMAIYYPLLHDYSTRFLTGTDFVSSLGKPEDWPGLKEFKDPPTGCMKDKANHARQLTDTSAVNIFFSDEAFQNIVLGNNYFRLTGQEGRFGAPSVCRRTEVEDDPSSGSVLSSSLFVFGIAFLFAFFF